MPQPPAPPLWTLNSGGLTGGSHKAKLVGCHIARDAQGVYTFYDPSWNVLATFSGTPLSCTFDYDQIDDWTVTLSTAVVDGNATGGWSTPGTELEDTLPQSGDYTAQTGGGTVLPEEASDKAKSSAGYGKG
jgi:hypothetical protein